MKSRLTLINFYSLSAAPPQSSLNILGDERMGKWGSGESCQAWESLITSHLRDVSLRGRTCESPDVCLKYYKLLRHTRGSSISDAFKKKKRLYAIILNNVFSFYTSLNYDRKPFIIFKVSLVLVQIEYLFEMYSLSRRTYSVKISYLHLLHGKQINIRAD